MPVPGSTPWRNDRGRSTRPSLVAPIAAPALVAVGLVLMLIAAVIVARSVIDSASARIAGSTSNDSSAVEAAMIDLTLGRGESDSGGAGSEDLAINATGLWPGRVVERCVPVRYSGSLNGVDVGLWVPESLQGSLADLVLVTIAAAPLGAAADDTIGCGGIDAGQLLFAGTLAELAADHRSYETAIPVMIDVADGAATTLRITAEVVDDNAAQGRVVDFSLLVEVRP